MRYAYAITGALLLGGATASLALQPAQQAAQNDPAQMQTVVPRAGAPGSFADLVAKLQPAVVNISTKQTITQRQQANPFQGTPFGDLFGQFGGGQPGGPPVTRQGASLGSGFIISADGYVVTNNHVIAPGARGASVDEITVTLPDRKEYTARVIGRDATSDLALLKINATNLPFVRFGDSTRARVGDWVVAIGNPFGLGGTVTAGIVSAVHRVTGQGGAYDRFLQTDAPINRGNSGGPMFNMAGEVIGINSQIFSETGGSVGIGFAIPTDQASPVIKALMTGGSVKRGYLGVQIGGPVDGDVAVALGITKGRGELIARVEPDGPAAKSGLRAGDIVTHVNGQVVNSEQTLSYLTANVSPGSIARLNVLRDGRPFQLNVAVASRPTEEQLAARASTQGGDGIPDGSESATGVDATAASLGLRVVPLTAELARQVRVELGSGGVVVVSVDQASDAASKLVRGDVVRAVNGTAVRTGDDFRQSIASARATKRGQVLILFSRAGIDAFVTVRMG